MKEYIYCRVCGLRYNSPPWGVDGLTPTFEVCDCCGVEFGYEDSTLSGIRNYRENWVENGAEWSNPKLKPPDWNLEKQLKNVPREFR